MNPNAQRKHADHRSKVKASPRFQPVVNNSAGPSAAGLRVGFPANRTVDLTYATVAPITSAAGSPGLLQFRLNSVFDPEAAIGGHQPMGYDQWSQFYNHYVVEECTYDITLVPVDSPFSMYFSTHISDDLTVPSTLSTLIELGATAAAWTPGTFPHVFRGKVNIAKFFNRKDIATDPELRAGVGTNPTEQCFLNLHSFTVNGSTTVGAQALMTLTYRVRFMEPKDLSPSMAIPRVLAAPRPFPAVDRDNKVVAACDTKGTPPPDDMFQYVRVLRE